MAMGMKDCGKDHWYHMAGEGRKRESVLCFVAPQHPYVVRTKS